MSEPVYINGSAALKNFIQGIHSRADQLLDERNINASGRLKKSNRTDVRDTFAASTATLSALGYWKTAGSGSPPGTKTDVNALQQWAMDKGLANNTRKALRIAMFVERKILREGSKQYREHGINVYSQAITEAQPRIPALLRAFMSDDAAKFRKQFEQTFKAA